jgi:putative transposase
VGGPRPERINLTERQEAELERIVRRPTSPQWAVTRARIILAASEGANNEEIGRQVGVDRQQVRMWRRRWQAEVAGLAAVEAEDSEQVLSPRIRQVLADRPRPGGPPTFSPEQLCGIIALACEPPDASGRPVTHWTPRELANEAMKRQMVRSISPRHVGRILNRGRVATPSQPLLAEPPPGR